VELRLKKLITICYKSQNADLFSENDSEKAIYRNTRAKKTEAKFQPPNESDSSIWKATAISAAKNVSNC
jgi:hypothetical protein